LDTLLPDIARPAPISDQPPFFFQDPNLIIKTFSEKHATPTHDGCGQDLPRVANFFFRQIDYFSFPS